MTAPACVCCGKPTSTGFLCRDGQASLRAHLRAVPAYVEALRESVARQVRFGGQTGGGGTEAPLPFNVDASEALHDLTSFLSRVAGQVADRLSEPVRHPTASAAAGYLLTRVATLNTYRGVGALYVELVDQVAAVVKVIDCPTDPTYLGVCDAITASLDRCTAILWASGDEHVADCRQCGAAHLVESRKAALAEQVRVGLDDRVMTATDAAEALIANGVVSGTSAALVDKIRKLARPTASVVEGGQERPARLVARYELPPRPGQRARPHYRVGDVIDLLTKTSRKTKSTEV